MELSQGVNDMDELPLILVIEDEYPIQGMVEDALTEGGLPPISSLRARKP